MPIKRSNFKIINDMSKENETSNKQEHGNDFIADVSFSLRDKFAIAAMNGELAAQNFETGEHWANEVDLAEKAYLIADAMIKARSNES